MVRRGKKILIFIIYIVALIICAMVWVGEVAVRYNEVNLTEVYSDNGVWDLREIDFSTTVVKLIGNVEHIPNEILTPEEFSQNEHKIEIGDPIDVDEGRTARLRAIMPQEGSYGLYTLGDYARRMYVNGVYVGGMGVPATNAEDFEAEYGEIAITAVAYDGILELIVQGGNFVHREGASYTSTYVGDNELLTWFVDFQTVTETVAAGIMLFLFVLHVMLAAVYRSTKLNMYFSAVCLCYFVRLSIVGTKIAYDIFRNMPWELAFKAEYITVALSSIFIVHIFDIQFSSIVSSWVKRVIVVLLGAFAIFFVFADTYTVSTMLIPLNALCLLATIVLIGLSIAHALRQKKEGKRLSIEQGVAIMSLIILIYATISDALYFSGTYLFGISTSIAELAILVFSISQAIAIFYTTMKDVEKAEDDSRMAKAKAESLETLNRMKTEFLQDMSHEMRTPLTVIGTGIEHANRLLSKGMTESAGQSLGVVKNETDRLGRMVAGMVDMSKLSAVESRRKTDFAQLISDSVESFRVVASKSGVELSLSLQKGLPFIYADRDSFSRLFSNLLSNAVRHTEGGLVEIEATYESSFVSVRVCDNGEGIEEDLLPHVTRRGITGGNGSGIGLYICKTVAEAHGGEFVIESEIGKGTCVRFTVPVYGGQEEVRGF